MIMQAAMMGADLEPQVVKEAPIDKAKFISAFKIQQDQLKKMMPSMQAAQMQAQMQGGQGNADAAKPIMVMQAKMQDEFFELTGVDDDTFQAAMMYYGENDAEVKAMIQKF